MKEERKRESVLEREKRRQMKKGKKINEGRKEERE